MTAQHEMPASEAARLIAALSEAGVLATVGGGWAVDALLGEQTRPHSDLDLWVPAPDLDPLIRVFADDRLDRLYPWGGDRPWNFVLHDGSTRRVDLHLYERLPDQTVHYGSVDGGDRFPSEYLDGRGSINGDTVRCETPAWALECHTGYNPRPSDRDDVVRLCTKYALRLPDAYR